MAMPLYSLSFNVATKHAPNTRLSSASIWSSIIKRMLRPPSINHFTLWRRLGMQSDTSHSSNAWPPRKRSNASETALSLRWSSGPKPSSSKYLDHFLLQNNSSNFARSTDTIVFTLRKISKCIGSLFQSRIIHLSGHCLTSRDCGQAVVLIS